jgi:hypothetical protein
MMINNVFVSIAVPFLRLIRAERKNVCVYRSWMFFYSAYRRGRGSGKPLPQLFVAL